MQLMRCNHCPFGSLGQFLQLFQRRLFGPFGPRTEFSMGSMWNVPTCSIERAQFFIPWLVVAGEITIREARAMIALWGLEESPGHQLSHQRWATFSVGMASLLLL